MQQGAPGEDLHVPGLVRGLDGEQLLDLPEVRVHAGEQAGGDDQRGLLVLDEVGHDLHDGGLDVGGHRWSRSRSQSTAVAGSHCAAAACA